MSENSTEGPVEVTLVHDEKKPNRVTSSNPNTITTLRMKGYRILDDSEVASQPTGYAALNGKQLDAEIARRNADRDEAAHITPDGRRNTDKVAALEADDAAQEEQANAAAGTGEGDGAGSDA